MGLSIRVRAAFCPRRFGAFNAKLRGNGGKNAKENFNRQVRQDRQERVR
jgi:hypothetical protein